MSCHGPKPAPAPPPSGHSASAENAPGATDCRKNIATLVAISAVVTGGMRRTWGCDAGTQGAATELVDVRGGADDSSGHPVNQRAGTVTSAGKNTNRANTSSSATMNGHTPLMMSSIEILDTPHT